MSTNDWLEIAEGFRGRRLAVWDDIAEGKEIDTNDARVEAALGWLIFHRFVWHDGTRLVTRTMEAARTLWKQAGAAKEEAANVARQAAAPIDAALAWLVGMEPRAVHPHQTSLFAN